MKPLTPVGVARILQRGIKANFSPENQRFEVDKLVEYFEALIMSREDEIKCGDCDLKTARADVEFMQDMVDELDLDFVAGVNK